MNSLRDASALSVRPDTGAAAVIDTPQDFEWLRQNIPCQAACPAGTDIPGYLEAIYHDRFDDAYAINLRDNVFPAVLGRVCSRPCEAACRHGWAGNGESVAICFSKRSAADFATRRPVTTPRLFGDSGKRVTVVGAGVAGLAAARELARFGHAVTVLEKHGKAGGMLNQGIPAFRLPRDVIEREVEQVRLSGVEIRCGVSVGRDVTLSELSGRFDAVVLAAGTLRPNLLPLLGAELSGIEHGLGFLLEVNELGRRAVGRNVLVLGGGYTAMDCARTALRLGARRVEVCYRRSREGMVVLPGELDEYLEEGGTLSNAISPLSFLGAEGRVIGVRFVRTRPGAPGRDGRSVPVEVPGSEFEVAADAVVLATGQFPQTAWIDVPLAAKLVGDDGWLASGAGHATAHANVFVAGDFALGATTLIQAIGHAKACALEVDAFLTGGRRVRNAISVGATFQSKCGARRTTGREARMNAIALHPMPTLVTSERGLLSEVESGYDRDSAREAASRCYLCHYKFEISDAKCVLCDECLLVKPVPGCIVEIAGLLHDEAGAITGYVPVERGKTDSLYYNRLWIDQNQCVRCGRCEAACPVNAITIQKVSLATAAA